MFLYFGNVAQAFDVVEKSDVIASRTLRDPRNDKRYCIEFTLTKL